MTELIFRIASNVLQINIRDPHDVPFALPLLMSALLGFIIGFVVLQFINDEQQEDN